MSSVSLQRSQDNPDIPLFTLGAIQAVLFDVFLDNIWYQVANALAPPEGSPDLGGRDVIGDPFVDQVNVGLVSPQHIGFIDEFLSIVSSPGNTYDPIVSHNCGDVLTLPQVGNTEGLQQICPTQQLDLRHGWGEEENTASGFAF